LNDGNVPDLRVSGSFERMIKEYSGQKETRESREALMFLRQKVEAARAFIDLVELRRQTLVSTMEAIVRMQHDYLVDGDESLMKPMLMKDVAEATGLDISTISRVSSSKYVETSFGIFPLKHFFGDSYRQPNFNRKKQPVEEDSDTTIEEQTTLRQIKAIIQQCVDNEDKKTPMTDEQLMEKLKEQGLNLARRTVAKYRQQLGIPVARMRR
jgi:RNA polymerase sigma-54 factor